MAPLIIDGKAAARSVRDEIAREVSAARAGGLRPPGLAVVIVGEDPASRVYVRNKDRAATELGFHSVRIELPAATTRETLLATLAALNADPAVDGILCQLPLPSHLDEREVILAIDPDKDADGLHPVNAGRLSAGLPGFVPCTPLGCMVLLQRHNIETAGKKAVVVGRSNLVGTPIALLLARKGADATVTICHSRTRDLAAECARADILVAAIGRAEMIGPEYIKDGAVVIDVGINRLDDPSAKSGYRLAGDVNYATVAPKCSAITPVPGGVGPMTIAMLMRNTLESWRRRTQHSS